MKTEIELPEEFGFEKINVEVHQITKNITESSIGVDKWNSFGISFKHTSETNRLMTLLNDYNKTFSFKLINSTQNYSDNTFDLISTYEIGEARLVQLTISPDHNQIYVTPTTVEIK